MNPHLHTVEVVGSNPIAPKRRSITIHGIGCLFFRLLVSFKEHEAAAFPGPRHQDRFHSVFITLGSWNSGMDVAPVLKEIQMPPRSLLGIMHCTPDSTYRAGMGAPVGEIYADMHL